MERAIEFLYAQTRYLEKSSRFATYLAGGALIACYFLNRKVKKLNNDIRILQAKE